jgi:uncharacterized membrane protein YhiD involved in acid resistance
VLAARPMSESHILRFLVTIVLAITFGLARQWFGKPIGFGTFVFVSIGACALLEERLRGFDRLRSYSLQ